MWVNGVTFSSVAEKNVIVFDFPGCSPSTNMHFKVMVTQKYDNSKLIAVVCIPLPVSRNPAYRKGNNIYVSATRISFRENRFYTTNQSIWSKFACFGNAQQGNGNKPKTYFKPFFVPVLRYTQSIHPSEFARVQNLGFASQTCAPSNRPSSRLRNAQLSWSTG